MTVPNAGDCRWSTWDGKQNGEVLHHSAKLRRVSRKSPIEMNAFTKGRLVYHFWVQYWFMDQIADTDLSWKEGNAM